MSEVSEGSRLSQKQHSNLSELQIVRCALTMMVFQSRAISMISLYEERTMMCGTRFFLSYGKDKSVYKNVGGIIVRGNSSYHQECRFFLVSTALLRHLNSRWEQAY